jgi:hypothetical protein
MVIFRADVSPRTGLRPLRRCAYLASLLSKGSGALLCCREDKKAAKFLAGGEFLGLANHGFGSTQHQYSVGGQQRRYAVQNLPAFIVAQVHQHVAAQDDIERPEMARAVQHIVLGKRDHFTQAFFGDPFFALLFEIAQHLHHRQPALDFELGITPVPRLRERGSRYISGINLDVPAAPLLGIFTE